MGNIWVVLTFGWWIMQNQNQLGWPAAVVFVNHQPAQAVLHNILTSAQYPIFWFGVSKKLVTTNRTASPYMKKKKIKHAVNWSLYGHRVMMTPVLSALMCVCVCVIIPICEGYFFLPCRATVASATISHLVFVLFLHNPACVRWSHGV